MVRKHTEVVEPDNPLHCGHGGPRQLDRCTQYPGGACACCDSCRELCAEKKLPEKEEVQP